MNKETGIIMSGNHPKLILDGTKTMTRRVIKPQPDNDGGWSACTSVYDHNINEFCPYGEVGDRLWVRETYSMDWWQAASMIVYKADLQQEDIKRGYLYDPIMEEDTKLYWKSALFMHRWKSRITLQITELRAERLQEISLSDCIAEGAKYMPDTAPREQRLTVWKIVFAGYWDSLNARRGYEWDTNCWVWVISFKVIE